MAYVGACQNINGKVVDKYRLGNRNIGIVVEDKYGKRYSVEFGAYGIKPNLSNLFGLIDEPFRGRGESLDKLVNKGDYIGIDVGRSDDSIKYGYRVNYVSSKPVSGMVEPISPIEKMYRTKVYAVKKRK